MFKRTALLLVMPALLSGCLVQMVKGNQDLTTIDREQNQAIQKKPHVYAMRGLLGIFSTGMDKLANAINKELDYPTAVVSHLDTRKLAQHIIKQKRQGKLKGPIVLVGHSYGADSSVDVAEKLNKENIPVSLLIPIDNTAKRDIPKNVKQLVHIHSGASAVSQMLFGWGNPLKVEKGHTKLKEVDVSSDKKFKGINHFNIDKNNQMIRYLVKLVHTI